MGVNIEVEYCGTCGYGDKFEEMRKTFIKHPDVNNITGFEGRRASFEVKINEALVHSKLSTLAFPDFEDVSIIASEVAAGKAVTRNCKQQAITDCIIM